MPSFYPGKGKSRREEEAGPFKRNDPAVSLSDAVPYISEELTEEILEGIRWEVEFY